jgi:hypothetical protein
MIEIPCVIINVEMIFYRNSDKRREWMIESDCLYVGHSKPKIWIVLLANLWLDINLNKDRIWDVSLMKVVELSVNI